MKLLTLILALCLPAHAVPVTLAWEPSPASDKIAHYAVSYASTGAPAETFKVTPKATTVTTSAPIQGLDPGVWQIAESPDLAPGTYTFTVRAVTAVGLASPPSASVVANVLPRMIQKFQIVIDLKGTITLTPQ
jgi:hypothetical protein